MKQQYKDQFENLPDPVWSRLKLPEKLFVEPIGMVQAEVRKQGVLLDKVLVESIQEKHRLEVFGEGYTTGGSKRKTLGEKFTAFTKGFTNGGYVIHTKQNSGEPLLHFHYHLDENAPTLSEENIIIADEGSLLTVIFEYSGEASLVQKHFVITQVIAKQGSKVKIITLQNLGNQAEHYQQFVSEVEEGAVVEQFDFQMGAALKAVAFESDLKGRHSQSEVYSLYYGRADEQLDLSYTMAHQGAQSESLILSKGVLDDRAVKTFRGNLFFDSYSEKSKGREAEYVVLLSDQAKSDSIPALLCTEDDVIGEHAASIGRMDPEKMFYLMSRGLSEIESKKTLIKASFEEVLDKMNVPSISEGIRTEIEGRFQ